MNPEQDASKEVERWLDGLAGRAEPSHASADPALQDGLNLRRALDLPLSEAAHHAPPWARIRQRAGLGAELHPVVPEPQQPICASRGNSGTRPAPSPWAWPLVACLALGLGGLAGWNLRPGPPVGPDPAWRGESRGEVLWLTVRPQLAAAQLAQQLRAAGADVTLSQADGQWHLHIRSPEAKRAQVDAKLLPLDAALDAQGRLHLRISDDSRLVDDL